MAAAICRLCDYELVLIHVSHPLVSMGNLRYVPEIFSCIPFIYASEVS